MSPAMNLDKAPSHINTQRAHLSSTHATRASPQKSKASQDDATTRKLDSTSAANEIVSSEEVLSTPPAAPSHTVFPFFRLPPELRDEIYIYASLTEKVWIGRPPRPDHTRDGVIVENTSIYKPATLIRTEHSIIGVCHETRDEFRTAMWREYMTGPRVVHFRVYDFAFSPLNELFAKCSAAEVKKLQKRDKCSVHHHITTAFHKYRRSKSAYQEIVNVVDAWLVFEMRAPMDAQRSIDECDWYDAKMLRNTLLDDHMPHVRRWATRWECRLFLELWDAVSEACKTRSAARINGRNAFHKLAPLGQ